MARDVRAMPRYFFHVENEIRIEDHLGIQLTGPEEAWREMSRIARIAKVLLPDAAFAVVVTEQEQSSSGAAHRSGSESPDRRNSALRLTWENPVADAWAFRRRYLSWRSA